MFAAIYIPDFPVEAVVRARPELRDHAIVVIEGAPPLAYVVALNDRARELGLHLGMTRMQAEAFAASLHANNKHRSGAPVPPGVGGPGGVPTTTSSAQKENKEQGDPRFH